MGKLKFTKKQIVDAVIISICNVFTGILISSENVTESSVTSRGISESLMLKLIVIYALIIFTRFILRIFEKDLRINILNSEYVNYNEKAINSNSVDVQRITVGTIFDAVKEISSMKGNVFVYALSIVPTIIPAISLIIKELNYKEIVGIMTIISMVITFLISFSAEKLFKWNEKAKQKKAILQSITTDNFMNLMTIKFMGFEKLAIDRLKKAQEDALPYTNPKKKFAYYRLIDITNGGVFIASLWMCRQSLAMIGMIVVSSYTVQNISSALSDLTDMISEIKAQEKIINSIDGKDNNKLPYFVGSMSLKDVEFGYNDEMKFTIEENIKIDNGKRYLITGESGEGKSSLLNLIAGLLKPTKGEVNRYDVFYISQNITCLNDTLWRNLVGNNEYNISEQEILDLLNEVNLLEWFNNKLTDGFNTYLGERGCKLSFGQIQRINIIRAVLAMRYTPQKIFLLDEITSNLDDKSKEAVISLIDRECHSTCIIVAHDSSEYAKIIDEHIIVQNHMYKVA